MTTEKVLLNIILYVTLFLLGAQIWRFYAGKISLGDFLLNLIQYALIFTLYLMGRRKIKQGQQ